MRYSRYWMSSILLNALLIISAGVYFDFLKQKPVLAESAPREVSAYLYQDAVNRVRPVTKQTLTPIKKNAISLQKKIMKPVSVRKSPSSKINTIASHGEKSNELLMLLHTAIQQHQTYPLSAQQMGREGRTTVTFLLSVTGEVSNVLIKKSSGTDSLDAAALAAVKAAAPFKQMDHYIKNAEVFTVDVVFSA